MGKGPHTTLNGVLALLAVILLVFLCFGPIRVAIGLPLMLLTLALALVFGLAIARIHMGLGRPPPATGPLAALIGRTALVIGLSEGRLVVRLDGQDWPARLPPFTPPPPFGTQVRVEAVADATLVVRPD